MSESIRSDTDVQILDKDGSVLPDATVPDLDDDTLVEMYAQMRLCRSFDERAVSLQRQGRSGTYSTMLGHEGTLVGSAFALAEDDWIVPYYRDQGATVTHGLPLENILMYYMGHEQGSVIPEDVNVMPICITIADHIPHATGIAWASKLKGEESATVCYFGDGATSEGDFHEGLNFAGVMDTPNLFICMNNQWAISTPFERQTAADTIAQKAQGYGFEGIRVDGMDPLAVYTVTQQAREKALDPDADQARPTLIETLLYRIGAHNTSDDPSAYRGEEEVEEWREWDPLPRLETFLRERGLLDDEEIDAIEERNTEQVEAAVEAAENVTADPEEMFEHVYAEQTQNVREQQEYLRRLREEFGDEQLLED
ncbi:pyruvate dehydrogenase (acetyl-transferring) E1 component subunit alpha [Halorientalis halophila]|uniref:pyruvate dehydrogenase (acetyl-transferring) E1 component subunit alpha n=1 Tax=Halorientalis halophila TaxID=3108499 RepID=UPI00300A7294